MAGRGSYRSRVKKRQSRLYFLLVLIVLFGLFKWGFPFFIKIIASTGNQTKRVVINGEDLVPPQKPVIAAVPEATNSAELDIEGYTEAGVEVFYLVNNKEISSEMADKNGFFKTLVGLKEGGNSIKVKAKDKDNNESLSDEIKVVYDHVKPEITIEFPADGQEFFGKQSEVISVSGEVSEPEANLTINSTFVRLDKGIFNFALKLTDGENEIKLVAKDAAGNTEEKTIKVDYLR